MDLDDPKRRFTLALSRFGSSFPSLQAFALASGLLAATVIQSAPAQTVSSPTTKKNSTPAIDFSLGVFGQLTPTRLPTTTTSRSVGIDAMQTTQGTSPSAGVLGTFHQSFKPWLGYNVNLGYSRFSENYSRGEAFVPNKGTTASPFSEFSQGSIDTNLYETTVAYAVRGPKIARLSTFAQIGGGGVWFLPTQNPSAYREQVRLTMVFGGGFNYKLSDHFGVRAEYRGLFYKSPDFRNPNAPIPISKLFTATSEPTVSIVYSFGGEGNKKKATKH
jgi:opacity protein-like surface antigen